MIGPQKASNNITCRISSSHAHAVYAVAGRSVTLCTALGRVSRAFTSSHIQHSCVSSLAKCTCDLYQSSRASKEVVCRVCVKQRCLVYSMEVTPVRSVQSSQDEAWRLTVTKLLGEYFFGADDG